MYCMNKQWVRPCGLQLTQYVINKQKGVVKISLNLNFSQQVPPQILKWECKGAIYNSLLLRYKCVGPYI